MTGPLRSREGPESWSHEGRAVVIEKVSFRNFKAYRSLDLELEPLTVLVGPNAAGKTTLLQGLHLATAFASGHGIATTVSEDTIRTALASHGETDLVSWNFSGTWSGEEGHVGVRFETSFKDISVWGELGEALFEIIRAPLSLRDKNKSALWAASLVQQLPPNFRRDLHSTSILRFELQCLADASYSEESIPSMDGSGNGLASVLAYLKLGQDDIFDDIQQALRQIVPSVRRIRIERAAVERTAVRTIALDEQRHQVPEQRKLWGNKVVLDMNGAKGVAADSIGEGTLMALGLLTVLMSPDKPRLILLDDIEIGLHPVAQGKLIETLRRFQERDPELQIVATSHSPFILNYLKPEEVRMVFLSEDGSAHCEKLTAHPEFARWRDMMSPGEFWSTVGESWVAKTGASESHE